MEEITDSIIRLCAVAGPGLLLLGALGFGLGALYVIIVSVQTGCLGFISVFIPFLNIYWAVKNWEVAQNPVLVLVMSAFMFQIGNGLSIIGALEVDGFTMIHVVGFVMMQMANMWLFYRAMDRCSATGEWWYPVIPLMSLIWVFKAWEHARAPVILFGAGLAIFIFALMNDATSVLTLLRMMNEVNE